MSSPKELLEEINRKIKLPFSSLKELSELYLETKRIVFNDEELGNTEILAATSIFMEGFVKVREYLLSKKVEELTDEELNLLLVLCDEASVNFDYLMEVFSSSDNERLRAVFTKEEDKKRQEDIQNCRENIIEEKAKRKVKRENNDNSSENYNNESKVNDNVNELLNESLKKRISELQKEVDFLRNKNKPKEADRLQERVNKIKEGEKNPEKNPNSFSPAGLLVGIGIVLVIGFIVFLVIGMRKKK